MSAKERVVQRTEYPHIVKVEGVCGGDAIIEGTRIAVWHVVDYYYKVGMSVEEFLADWDYLNPAAAFSALAYYHDHKEEIDQARYENSYEYWLEHHMDLTLLRHWNQDWCPKATQSNWSFVVQKSARFSRST